MDRYLELKELVKDYVDNVNEINEKKIRYNEKELDLMRKELVCFNLLQKNLARLEGIDALSEDPQPV